MASRSKTPVKESPAASSAPHPDDVSAVSESEEPAEELAPIQQLAELFTGTFVAHMSMMKEHAGGSAERMLSEKYFAVREALGIRGYDNTATAVEAINEALYEMEDGEEDDDDDT